MKLGFQILILMVFCFSCKDEKVFDSSPSERNANHIGELRKKLVNAPYGWAVTYFPRTDSLLFTNVNELIWWTLFLNEVFRKWDRRDGGRL